MIFVGYGRHSSDRQNPKSAEDQLHEIQMVGEAKGWIFFGDTQTRRSLDQALSDVMLSPH